MSNWRVTRRAAFCTGLIAMGTTLAACQGGAAGVRRAVPSYDLYSGRMVQLSADQNGDGRLDQWTYLDANRPLRGEADLDGDGRIDQWEYFDEQAGLVLVGASSRHDGVEDVWTYPPSRNGERQVALSRRRDRQIDRREFFQGDVLVRAEEDTNADGRVDRWDRYEGQVLREASYDTSLNRGRPDRRLLYDDRGRFERIEADPEGDGKFVPLSEVTSIGTAGEKR